MEKAPRHELRLPRGITGFSPGMERVLRFAAWLGDEQKHDTPVVLDNLIRGFAFADADLPALRALRDSMLAESASGADEAMALRSLHSGRLPTPLSKDGEFYSMSVRRLFEQARNHAMDRRGDAHLEEIDVLAVLARGDYADRLVRHGLDASLLQGVVAELAGKQATEPSEPSADTEPLLELLYRVSTRPSRRLREALGWAWGAAQAQGERLSSSRLLFGISMLANGESDSGDAVQSETTAVKALAGALGSGPEKWLRDNYPGTSRANVESCRVGDLSPNVRRIVDAAAELAGRGPVPLPLRLDHVVVALLSNQDARVWRRLARELGVSRASVWRDFRKRTQGQLPASIGIAVPVADVGGHTDLLGVEDEANAVARICASRDVRPPMAIGVFGPWGSGKTFFMELVHRRVRDIAEQSALPEDPFHRRVVQIRFNAWHYVERNLWASLVEHIFAELDGWLHKRIKDQQGVDQQRERIEMLFEQLSTSRALKLDATKELVEARRGSARARADYERASKAHETAAKRTAEAAQPVSIAAIARAVWRDPSLDKRPVEEAARSLGFADLGEQIGRFAELVQHADSLRGRAGVVWQALRRHLGKPWFVIAVASVVLLLPIAFSALSQVLEWQWLQAVREGVGFVGWLVGSVTTALAVFVNRSSSALDRLASFREQLDSEDRKQRDERSRELGALRETLRATEAAVEHARAGVESASDAEAAALRRIGAGTARSRLNDFIRAKVEEGDYARHLGIVASIRRDFGELVRLMRALESGADDQVREEAGRRNQQHEQQVVDLVFEVLDEWRDGPKVDGQVAAGPLEHGTVQAVLAELREIAPERVEAWQLPDHDKRDPLALTVEEVRALLAGLDAWQRQDGQQDDPLVFERIILYVDDLDRCQPDRVVDVLQAVHLLLGFELFVVLVAVDKRWVARALSKQYEGLLTDPNEAEAVGQASAAAPGDRVAGAASAGDYLEKIFQIPYWVRPMNEKSSQDYVGSLVPEVAQRPVHESSRPAGGGPQVDSDGDGGTAAREADRERATTVASPSGAGGGGEPAQGSDEGRDAERDSAAATADFDSVRIDVQEREAMRELAPCLGGSPRRAKRFVNVYRLIKSAAPEAVASPKHYRSVLVQLAIATGTRRGPMSVEELREQMRALPKQEQIEEPANDEQRVRFALQRAAKWGIAPLDLGEHTELAYRYSFTNAR